MKKLFFFDIDGTLIACEKNIKSIPSNTRDALDTLKKNDNGVFLATGRCPCFLLDGVTNYTFDGIVSCNGALAMYDGKVKYKKAIPLDAINTLVDLANKHHFVAYMESIDHIYCVNPDHEIHDAFVNEWGMREETIVTDFKNEEIDAYIAMIGINEESQVDILNEHLSEYFEIQQHQNRISFDLTIKGESKAKGIEELSKSLNITMEDTVAFGDGNNDIEMIGAVGMGIAMGNAAKPTKEKADYITSNVEEDGIIKALKHYNYI